MPNRHRLKVLLPVLLAAMEKPSLLPSSAQYETPSGLGSAFLDHPGQPRPGISGIYITERWLIN
ncbi:hypothetical protein M422DRAFT_37926, partial [Sphaerobolus stellatus SS14]